MNMYSKIKWTGVSWPVWRCQAGVHSVTIFGDCDRKYGGQAAIFTLAHRLACNEKVPIEVTVEIPKVPGSDWADVLVDRQRRVEAA